MILLAILHYPQAGGVAGESETFPESPLSPGYGPLLSPLEEEEDTSGLQSLERELSSIRLEITVIADKIRADAETAKIESEWKFAAMVIII